MRIVTAHFKGGPFDGDVARLTEPLPNEIVRIFNGGNRVYVRGPFEAGQSESVTYTYHAQFSKGSAP